MSLFMSALVLVRLSGQSVHCGDAVSSISYANLRLRSETHESRLIVVTISRAPFTTHQSDVATHLGLGSLTLFLKVQLADSYLASWTPVQLLELALCLKPPFRY